MKLTEMASLLGKGYKVEDLKELATIAATTPEALEMAKTGAKVSDIKDLIAMADAGEDKTGTTPPDPEQGKDDPTPDYKQLYDNLKKKSEELEAQVSKLQEDNTRKNTDGGNVQKDPEDILADIMKDYT